MINNFKNKHALLVGNGVNLLDWSQSVSWGVLLNELKRQYGINVDLDNEFKPFPIGFEEMRHLKKGGNSIESKLRNLKTTIREVIDFQLQGKNGFNEYHYKICTLNYDDILTTNYDYALEMSIADDFKLKKSKKYAQNKQERKFSLKRYYGGFDNTISNIWHIHGELESSRNISTSSKQYLEESIMIGYEHYSDYLELIQGNINGKKGKRIVENQSVISRIKNNNTGVFWTDIFFTHNIDIIGLGLDFSENHLWWLLNKRGTLIKNNPSDTDDKKVNFNNSINYYYPIIEGDNILSLNPNLTLNEIVRKKNSLDKAKAIAEVLKSFEVNPMPIVCNGYKDFYDKYILLKLSELKKNRSLYPIF